MKYLKGSLLLLFIVISIDLLAQSPYEALRYSETSFLGTSRGRALSGAYGALGGDFTALGINPAGIGVFRKNEFMITLGVQGKTNFSGYANSETDDLRIRPNIPNLGFVFTKLFQNDKGQHTKGKWRSFNFAIGVNRTADFNENRYWQSKDQKQSILPALANELNGINPSQISLGTASTEAVMAWQAYLINPIPSDTSSYYSLTDNRLVTQKISTEITGGISEISMTFGGNYYDKLYFGAYFGIPILHYNEKIKHQELDEETDYTGFNDFEMNQTLSTLGVGFNAKFGLLYRVNNYFRLGASFHTPTIFGVEDEYSGDISSNLDTISYSYETPDGNFNYNMSTPWRANASAAVMFGKYGFFSIDYEYVDYRKARYFFDSEYSAFENNINDDIDNIATNASNIRAGLEIAVKQMRFRGGYAIFGSPLAGETFLGVNSAQMASGGFGIRFKKMYIDASYNRLIYKEKLNVAMSGIQSTDKVVRNMVTGTIGFRF